jgi:hypothetical protein
MIKSITTAYLVFAMLMLIRADARYPPQESIRASNAFLPLLPPKTSAHASVSYKVPVSEHAFNPASARPQVFPQPPVSPRAPVYPQVPKTYADSRAPLKPIPHLTLMPNPHPQSPFFSNDEVRAKSLQVIHLGLTSLLDVDCKRMRLIAEHLELNAATYSDSLETYGFAIGQIQVYWFLF